MRKNIIYAWIISSLFQAGIILALYLNYTLIHLKGSALHIFSISYPIISGIIGILLPVLLYFITGIWYYGIKSSIVTGFFALIIFAIVTYYLMTQPEARGVIFLPVIIGIIEGIYITGNLAGTLLVYVLNRRKLKP